MTGRAIVPIDWGVCDSNSTPDIRFEYEYSDGFVYSRDGSQFVLLRTRGAHYVSQTRPPGTAEGMFTQLMRPLETGYCYRITVDLANAYDERSSYPLRFQMYGSNDSCGKTELLYESSAINSTEFEKYYFSFELTTQDYEYIFIVPGWDTINYAPERYDGFILIDNLNISRIKPVNQVFYDSAYFKIDPPLRLHAMDGIGFLWNPREPLSSALVQSPFLREYEDTLLVQVADLDGCPAKQYFYIKFDCDSVYARTYQKDTNVYFKYNIDVLLEASNGASHYWIPSYNLSSDTVQSPQFLGYEDLFAEEITYIDSIIDKYGCPYSEKFNVIRDCDTIFPNQGPITMLDTFSQDLPKILLQPQGTPTAPWIPAEGLSCVDCLNPIASPFSSTVYTITLTDEIECPRQEIYKIQVGLKIPNVITPNGDKLNDEFIVPGLPPESTLYIYEKDGILVYQHQNYGYKANGNGKKWWDGSKLESTDLVKKGNYWYVLEIPEKQLTEKGFVFVIY